MNARIRVLEYLNYKKISRSAFYRLTGFSNGYLDKEAAMSTDKCEKIFYFFPDINPEWLLTGYGVMLRGSSADETTSIPETKTAEVLVERIIELTTENLLLKQENSKLKNANEGYKDRFSTDSVKDNLAAEL